MSTAGPVQIAVTDLSVTQPNVYEGRGSSKSLHRVVDSFGRSGLWKEYKEDVVETMDAQLLVDLVRWPSTLGPRERERMLPYLAHPYSVVMRGRQAVGVVMPEAPALFSYRDRRGRSRPRTIDTLSNSRRATARTGAPFFEPPHRLALLGRLLILVSELHDAGVVVGDLQPQNILVTGDPRDPAVMVLDCDSFWLDGRHAFGQPTDPETWRSPWMGDSFTNQTDLFKLALLVTRCLQEDNRDWYPKRDVLTQYMPTHQVERLEGLLAKEISVSAQQLRGLAGNWRARVGSNGTMYTSTDQYLHAPWIPPADPEATGPAAAAAPTPPWGTRPEPGQPYHGSTHPNQNSQPAHLTSNPPTSGRPTSNPLSSNPPTSPGYRPGGPPANFPATPPPRTPSPTPQEPIRSPTYMRDTARSQPPPPPPPTAVPTSAGAQQHRPSGVPGQRNQRMRAQLLGWLVFAVVAAGIVFAAIYGQ